MRRSRSWAVAVMVVGAMALATPAFAEPLEPYLERSATAAFAGEQVVTCDTPDGSRTVAIDLTQTDGVTTARPAAGGANQVRVAGGSFSVVTESGSVDTSAVTSSSGPVGRYTVSAVEQVRVIGRPAERITVIDAAGLERATMTFDVATGALLASRIRNADGSLYCEIRMVELADNPVSVTAVAGGLPEQLTLEPTEPAPGLPEDVAGFARIETFTWDEGGVLSYYSDGLFSFALLSTRRPVVLDAATATPVSIDGGEYVRWFGAGQSIHVWDSSAGGLAMYGDLPLDLQAEVLAELPDPERVGVLTRWWRNLFG